VWLLEINAISDPDIFMIFSLPGMDASVFKKISAEKMQFLKNKTADRRIHVPA
jgi:hypothetical protein